MPLDKDDDAATIFTNHAIYYVDWMDDVLEPILDGSREDATPFQIREANANARERPGCQLREDAQQFDGVSTISYVLMVYVLIVGQNSSP